ncbi:MAG: NADH-quinone oxidoreductase subunit B [Propionibacteriaceae bacterium]|jgi:NADH-quinone oxidoreductase subunit B|nr:NADH-quinone oxidoreductase subunit B [Propionibacteriaceae bacterium]
MASEEIYHATGGVENHLPQGVVLTSLEAVFGWMRQASFWPATFGLACCAIEMMTYGAPRFDSGRWGQEVFRASPRQADLMIISGRVSQKMAPVLRTVYDQMPNPKWVLAMGVCASSGGMFNNYAVVQGGDHLVPVDIYVPGCPPRPDMLIDAMFKLKKQIVAKYPMAAHEFELRSQAEAEALDAPSTLDMKGLMK